MFGSWEKALKGMDNIANEFIGADDIETETQDYSMRGFASTARIATEYGWRQACDIKIGDRVFTFDNGLQVVKSVSRGTHFVASDSMPDFTSPLHVPMHALGNEEPMILLPEQVVMLESDVAEDLIGDPFALIPAKLLVGFRGIERFRSLHPVEMVTLHFEDDEVIYADGGALMLSPAAAEGIAMMDVFDGTALPAPYTVWKGDDARKLIDNIAEEDARAHGFMQMSTVA